jgi:integrase/recombinase XerD
MIDLEKKPRERLILKFLYYGAFRVAELVSIRWKDLSFSFDRVSNRQVVYVAILGKGTKQRTETMFGKVVEDLIEFKFKNESKTKFLFCSREEGSPPLHQSRINGIVKKASLRAYLLKPVSPHWLRHAHATHAIERGAPIHLVRDTLGHSSIQTTGIYLDINPKESSGNYLNA